MIRVAQVSDASAACQIYNPFVCESIFTFEENPVEVAEMARRIGKTLERFPWYVWEENGQVQGYAYASPWHVRPAYGLTVETTVYVSPAHTRRGIGTGLYEAVLEDLRAKRMHAAVGTIALPNPESVALHEHFGFRRVSLFREVGHKFGQWIDVGHWQLLL